MRLVLILAAVSASLAAAAPVPKNAKKTDFYPLAVGHKWEYAEADDVKTTEIKSVVTKDGATFFTLHYSGVKNPPPTQRRVFKFKDDEVFSLSTESSEAEKAGLIMKRVIRPNESWTTEHQWKGGELWTIKHSVGEAKKITVPAGEFLALPVTVENSGLGTEIRWYADGVGFVRKEIEGKVISELKSFTPGK